MYIRLGSPTFFRVRKQKLNPPAYGVTRARYNFIIVGRNGARVCLPVKCSPESIPP